MAAPDPWWRDAVVYQVYPRSFQDSDGDGEGDLGGIIRRLDHIASLGADALWLSPFYVSPMADGGYDIADHTAVDPRFGSIDDLDALLAAARTCGLRVLLDLVPSHTSIEHRWFSERPQRYVWAPGDGPPNNWLAAFGGPAWSRDERSGRWYLHSFYPQQPDLDWRNPEVPAAIAAVMEFWLARGVDGFRIDAVDRVMKDPALRDDPPATAPPLLPELGDGAALEHSRSRNAPDIGQALAAMRAAARDALLVGEVYLPSAGVVRYLEHLDAAFCFELLHAPWEASRLREILTGAPPRSAWVLSNHDFPRLPDRVGPVNARAAALLALALPGPVFVYQGDELGMTNGPGGSPPHDAAGRDAFRHPMAWDATAHGGFTTATPWLAVSTPAEGPADAQARAPDSTLAFYRDVIAARRRLSGPLELLEAGDGVLALRRGSHAVALNLATGERRCPVAGTVVRATDGIAMPAGTGAPALLSPGHGVLISG
jgi:alpha-glucosidase